MLENQAQGTKRELKKKNAAQGGGGSGRKVLSEDSQCAKKVWGN